MEETISSRCVTCTTKVPILLKKLIKTNGLIFSGKCSNSICPNPDYFVCKPCYDYTINNTTLKGGRKAAHFSTLRSLKQHVRTNNVHKIALKQFEDLQKINHDDENNDSNIEISNDNDTSITTDTNNNMSEYSNSVSHTNYDSFDSSSKSIKYYKYENKFPGHGPKFLIGNAFHKREEDFQKISNDEVKFF